MLFLAACAENRPVEARVVSMAEAMAFEEQIINAARSQPVPQQSEMLYTQPVNKAEPCKLPTSKEQLEFRNFRAYWDGDCKNGYAYGLGRDIALSDEHHVEEITYRTGNGYQDGQFIRLIDYVGNYSFYGAVMGVNKGRSGQHEFIKNENGIQMNSASFDIIYGVGFSDASSELQSVFSPFSVRKTTYNVSSGKPMYKLVDYSKSPSTRAVSTVLVIEDPATGKAGGFQIARYKNGVVDYREVNFDGSLGNRISRLPPEYIAHLENRISEATEAVNKAYEDAAAAARMERAYLRLACADDYSIKGVPAKDMKITRQICTWRDQWKEPYARAEAKYNQEMESLKQKEAQAAQAEQQRAYIAAQQEQAAAAKKAQAMENFNQVINGLNQAIKDTTPKSTYTNCYGTYGGVNCTSTSY